MARPDPPQDDPRDPLFLQARRELKVTLVTWLVFAVWVISVCWTGGRTEEGEELRTVLGMPSWVFWGVAVPWAAANVVTFWFCFGFMADAPLDRVPGESAEGIREDKGDHP